MSALDCTYSFALRQGRGKISIWDPLFYGIMLDKEVGLIVQPIVTRRCCMNYCIVVQAHGKTIDYLRGEANRVARDANTDWYAEPRDSGTAFCFENANVRTRFCAICAK